jgi:DNA-binding MarR family transcriptional regulator
VEILRSGNITEVPAGATDEQISFVIHGFVQVWNKFEDAIEREISTSRSLREPGNESRFARDNDILFRVGTTLSGAPSLSMGELSDALVVPLSTATRIIDALAERGLVHRFNDPDDRRVVRVTFTPKGKRLYRFIESRISERVRTITTYLTREELATLNRLLTKVALAVKETLK